MKKVLELDIKKQLGSFSLNVQASIGNGITGIYGPSGHGKTSMLNAVAGLIRPDSGRIFLNDVCVYNADEHIHVPVHKRKIGYVFQDIRLFPHLSVEQNLRYGLKKFDAVKIGFNQVVEVLQINHLLAKKPSECSGGEKQRISIGRALLSGAQILMMDEPFSAVDIHLRNSIIPFLNAINRRFQIPMLIVSHDLPDLLSLTDHLLLLKNGNITALGRFQDLIQDENNIGIMKDAGLYNVFNLRVSDSLPAKNMVLLSNKSNSFQVQVLLQSLLQKVEIGKPIKVLIRPEDISISRQTVDQISLRNQIQGKIIKIFTRKGLSFCLVDAGEKVLVEITEASKQKMNLDRGTTVYCLFKSAALKIFE